MTLILVGGNMGRGDGVDYCAKLAAEFSEVRFFSYESNPSVLESHIGEADAVIGEVPDSLLPQAGRLRWVQATGAGAESVSTPAYQEREGVTVTNTSGVHVASVPEHVLAMIFAFARALPEQILNQHDARDFFWPTALFEIEGQTIGILGLGRIGQSLAHKAKGLGMRVLGLRRNHTRKALHTLLSESDHVVITLPLTAETRHMVAEPEFQSMKESAYIYNVGRGPIIDQDALVEALWNGTIKGAGLDVTDPEPLPPDHPLWGAPNVIILSHYGGITPQYGPRAYEIIRENVRRFLTGEPLTNVVDKGRGY